MRLNRTYTNQDISEVPVWKAVYINEAGGPEVMIYGDRPNPEPEPGEILIRVRSQRHQLR